MTMDWPRDWADLYSGRACPMCAEDWPVEDEHGFRVLLTEFAAAYLQRADLQRGYVVVIWRGRHVAELAHLSPDERIGYVNDVVAVGAAIEQLYHPLKLNYMTLGNQVPHLHTHVIPRYAEDPAPGREFPFPEKRRPDQPLDVLRGDAERLRALLDAR